MSLKDELRKMLLDKGFNETKKDVFFLLQEIIKEIHPVKVGDRVTPSIIGIWDTNVTEGKEYIVQKVNGDYIKIIDDTGHGCPYLISRFHILQ